MDEGLKIRNTNLTCLLAHMYIIYEEQG